jgi:hypothetical protein
MSFLYKWLLNRGYRTGWFRLYIINAFGILPGRHDISDDNVSIQLDIALYSLVYQYLF